MTTEQKTEVTILLALFNGADHLSAQLDSYMAQTHSAWGLIVSDDGSDDAGPSFIRAFSAAQKDRRVALLDGPQRGFAKNFLHLLHAAGPDVPLVALSDQDDVWCPEKLARALSKLASVPANAPALYCARTRIVAPDLTPVCLSPRWRRPFGFANALVQNVAAGNTIVLNRAALDLVQTAAAADVAAHDWWLYQLVSGAGGTVIWDDHPVLLYRQHPGNEMGRNDTPGAWIKRLRQLASGQLRDWNDRNIKALQGSRHLLTPENRALLDRFSALRSSGPAGRVAGMLRAGLYRQTIPATLVLWLAAVFNRL